MFLIGLLQLYICLLFFTFMENNITFDKLSFVKSKKKINTNFDIFFHDRYNFLCNVVLQKNIRLEPNVNVFLRL